MRSIRLKLLGVAFVITLTLVQMAGAQQAPDVSQLALPGGSVQTNATPRTLALGGDIQVVVRLTDAPLAAAQGRNAKKGGGNLNAAQQRDYVATGPEAGHTTRADTQFGRTGLRQADQGAQ